MAKKLALTYDDGPNTPFTLDLLNVLAKHGVIATFFMVGQFVQARPDIAQQVSKAGHLVGNHTCTHPNLTELSLLDVVKEIAGCEKILTDAIGEHSKLFRPPFILTNSLVESAVTSLGLTTVMWKAAGSDWRLNGIEYVVSKVHKELMGGGGIILLHDGGHTGMGAPRSDTVQATDVMITRYKNEGYEFVTPLEVL
jgi:peptidoglycan/xylan/chitin deacetylase (PgdA/CDA1 family)